jgi:uncharacterized protein
MWKDELLSFAERFEHPAWGRAHYERIYEMTLQLARAEGAVIDTDVLFAAAYLHDMGAFDPYKQPQVEHSKRSAQEFEPVLAPMGFPAEKIAAVREVIQGHMFYARPASRHEAVLFHDADTLDFMGAVGIARMLSIVGLDDWTPDLRTAINLIERFSHDLPTKLLTPSAQRIGAARKVEMSAFLAALALETSDYRVV